MVRTAGTPSSRANGWRVSSGSGGSAPSLAKSRGDPGLASGRPGKIAGSGASTQAANRVSVAVWHHAAADQTRPSLVTASGTTCAAGPKTCRASTREIHAMMSQAGCGGRGRERDTRGDPGIADSDLRRAAKYLSASGMVVNVGRYQRGGGHSRWFIRSSWHQDRAAMYAWSPHIGLASQPAPRPASPRRQRTRGTARAAAPGHREGAPVTDPAGIRAAVRQRTAARGQSTTWS